MFGSASQEPPTLGSSEWSELVNQLPLFPPPALAPPALFPMLTPLLKEKLALLSLGKGRGWPSVLSWLPADKSHKVHERMKRTWRSNGLHELFRGYRRFDEELVRPQPYRNLIPQVVANVALEKSELNLWFSWVPRQDGHAEGGWKLHDIRLPEHDNDLRWFETIAEATMRFNRSIEKVKYSDYRI